MAALLWSLRVHRWWRSGQIQRTPGSRGLEDATCSRGRWPQYGRTQESEVICSELHHIYVALRSYWPWDCPLPWLLLGHSVPCRPRGAEHFRQNGYRINACLCCWPPGSYWYTMKICLSLPIHLCTLTDVGGALAELLTSLHGQEWEVRWKWMRCVWVIRVRKWDGLQGIYYNGSSGSIRADVVFACVVVQYMVHETLNAA